MNELEEFCLSTVNLIKHQAEGAGTAALEAMMQEMNCYANEFKNYYIFGKDMMFRREKGMEEMERQVW